MTASVQFSVDHSRCLWNDCDCAMLPTNPTMGYCSTMCIDGFVVVDDAQTIETTVSSIYCDGRDLDGPPTNGIESAIEMNATLTMIVMSMTWSWWNSDVGATDALNTNGNEIENNAATSSTNANDCAFGHGHVRVVSIAVNVIVIACTVNCGLLRRRHCCHVFDYH